MNIPKKIKIGGQWYKVTKEKDISRDRSAQGESCGNANWIRIDESLPKTTQDSVLIHEILEQINYLYELKLEHQTITILESSLYQVLRDNKLNFGE